MSYSHHTQMMTSAFMKSAARRVRPWLAAVVMTAPLTLAATACDDDSPTSPTDSAIVTFRVSDETFKVRLTTKEQVDAAIAAKNGGRANIPGGRLVAGTEVNTGWSWHLEDVGFAEASIELCDGRPSYVEQQGVSFGGGRFCPWSARIVSIQ
jgi:hypothetical protein